MDDGDKATKKQVDEEPYGERMAGRSADEIVDIKKAKFNKVLSAFSDLTAH